MEAILVPLLVICIALTFQFIDWRDGKREMKSKMQRAAEKNH